MTLPFSGPISLGLINLELGNPQTQQISLNDYRVRLLSDGIYDPNTQISMSEFYGKNSPGQVLFSTPGTYNWTVPSNVNSISAVCIGGGGGSTATWRFTLPNLIFYYVGGQGGGGGALAYQNNITVTPGEILTVIVGLNGAANTTTSQASDGRPSRIQRSGTDLVAAGGGTRGIIGNDPNSGAGGIVIVGSGFPGGAGSVGRVSQLTSGNAGGGGGGAGGYSGPGGNGSNTGSGANGSGGAGGGGAREINTLTDNGGGGVGVFGEGPSGNGGTDASPGGGGGSGGGVGGITGGSYGGGGGGAENNGSGVPGTPGGGGAVRIIWGNNRSFPSTNTNDITI